jgi:hypothetical protein
LATSLALYLSIVPFGAKKLKGGKRETGIQLVCTPGFTLEMTEGAIGGDGATRLSGGAN